MSSKPPPVPPANRSNKGPGGKSDVSAVKVAKPGRVENPDKQVQSANTRINTTPQGMQQDR